MTEEQLRAVFVKRARAFALQHPELQEWPRPNEEKLLDQSYPALLKTIIIFGLYSPLAGQSGLVQL